MKGFLIALTILASTSSFADFVRYSNSEGCLVEKDQRPNGVVLYVTKNGEQQVVGYANDYSFGDTVFCAQEKTEINFFEGSLGTGIMISCNGHENGHKVTRGRVDISLMGGELSEVSIDGQVRGLFGWKQDTLIECTDLVRE